MVTQATLKQEELPSRQADFRGVLTAPNGAGIRLPPGEEHLAGEAPPPSRPTEVQIPRERAGETVVLEGMLAASTSRGDVGLPVRNLVEIPAEGGFTLAFADRLETISLRIVPEEKTLNVEFRYVGKPLADALQSARFLDVLLDAPGRLAFESRLPVGERLELVDLPLAVPEHDRRAHHDRLEVLEALNEILLATGVEVRYPEDGADENGGLDALNFVLEAIRGGWVATSVDDFATGLGPEEVRDLLEELARDGEVGRAFLFDLPEESYDVFGTTVNLGPSRRYVAAATLATGREEMEAWLGSDLGDGARLDLLWEPAGGVPMHVFFEDWPKTTLGSIERELREFEAVYGVGTERFLRGRERGESWTREVQDAPRWAALVQAREELRDDPEQGS